MSELLAVGISHKTAPVALRERLALTEREAERFMRELVAREEIREAVAISTCNRTEIYLVVERPGEGRGRAARARSPSAATSARASSSDIVYCPRNCDAARHLFRVTSGLDSMIVGEGEVQGQVRRAHEAALAAGTTGPFTNRLFRAALQTGKRVRTETALGSARVSVPSVAVDLARETVGDLGDRSVLIIGAGETAELTARALHEQGVQHDVRRQPPRGSRTRARRALRRTASARSTSCPTGSWTPTSSSPRPPRRIRSSAPTSCASSWTRAAAARSS